MDTELEEMLVGTVEVWQNKVAVHLNHHELCQMERKFRQTLYDQDIPRLHNTCPNKCPIRLCVIVDTEHACELLDWKVQHHKGRNVTARFDFFCSAAAPVWFQFGPRKVRFNQYCCRTEEEYKR